MLDKSIYFTLENKSCFPRVFPKNFKGEAGEDKVGPGTHPQSYLKTGKNYPKFQPQIFVFFNRFFICKFDHLLLYSFAARGLFLSKEKNKEKYSFGILIKKTKMI